MSIYLTESEKEDYYHSLCIETEEDKIDFDIIDYLFLVNNIPGVCTTHSCSSHSDKDLPYLTFRFAFSFETVWSYTLSLSKKYDVNLKVLGENKPMFCFMIRDKESWQEFLQDLMDVLEIMSKDKFKGYGKAIDEDN